jgi:hypothetical protein
MYFAGESALGSENICDLFARFFGEVYADSDKVTDIQYQGVGGPAVLSFTVEDVERRLLGLDASRGLDRMGFHLVFWRAVMMGVSGR